MISYVVLHNYTPIFVCLQTSCTVGSEVINLKRAQHKIGDSFSKYIEWCFYVGVPMQPTLVFIVLLAKKGQSRPGYNARPYAQSRADVSKTLENVKGEFESFGELPSERETAIENRNSPLNCDSRK